jgi:chromosomal replication initiation ATPase DnaA
MVNSFGPRQLLLALDHPVSFAREDFLAGPSNSAALTLIERWPDWPNKIMALVGPEGSGKSHLANIWGQAVGARTLSARLISETDLPAAFATGGLIVEDLKAGSFDEQTLFHLLNLAREEQAYVLLTAYQPLASFTVNIPDLASRLRSIPTMELSVPDDTLLRAVIVKLAADRQLVIDQNLVTYLVNRIERSFAAARATVAQLDEEGLRQHRPVTRALAAELFREEP